MADEKQKDVETEVKPKEKLKVTVSGIIADLEAGLDRKAIAKKYGINFAEVGRIFRHPKLLGRKVKSAPAVEVIDDAPDVEPTGVYKAQQERKSGGNGNGEAKASKAAKASAQAEAPQVETTKGTW